MLKNSNVINMKSQELFFVIITLENKSVFINILEVKGGD